MIPLVLEAEVQGATADFVLRVTEGDRKDPLDAIWTADDRLSTGAAKVRLPAGVRAAIAGDVLLVSPKRGKARRVIRANSPHNFFLITEQCDQLCVMCSQPPKKSHVDLFAHYRDAARLAPHGAVITLTGGEPSLHKAALLDLISGTASVRPDVSFRVLTNAQHFDQSDSDFLRAHAGRLTWGVPLYSSRPEVHDEIVAKVGAFEQLLRGLALLARAGASIELRTVVMTLNVGDLVSTAHFVRSNLAFVRRWALMQLEPIGYARNRWRELFFDTSTGFEPIATAIEIAQLSVETLLYNFPLCTVPERYRKLAPQSISDWKIKYVSACANCPAKMSCAGFFEWYPENQGFSRIGLQ